ncbi:hypothetical protein [Selenomonas ruminantium]|uniref:Uncharacterized protein n=1 Tax=Selenomonas ruminantium TaxID=971 RepID=A0A1I0YA67_SELRU|nr:hypothetical protein [Selenomonas ruminantium]SFB10229.1 hypothetical protein SAMN05216587_11147 [Selenomonas ruminantium]
MGAFDLPHDEVFIYDDKKRCVAIIDGHPYESEVKEWIDDYGNPRKITVMPLSGEEYTVYEDGKIMNCQPDFM